jgi:hypothetical protein
MSDSEFPSGTSRGSEPLAIAPTESSSTGVR